MKWYFKNGQGAGLGVVTKITEAGGKLRTSEKSEAWTSGLEGCVVGTGAGLACGGRLDLEFILSICITFLLTDFYILCLVAQSCPNFCNPMDCSPPGSSVHGDSPGKNTGVGCHAHLQGIFPTQGSNPGLPHCKSILYHLSHQGSPFYILFSTNQLKTPWWFRQ